MSIDKHINIQTSKLYDTNSRCEGDCLFKYNYGKPDCTLVNEGDYLNIVAIDNNNENISYSQTGKVNLKEIRLYSHGITKFNEKFTDATLVLRHVGNMKNLYVVIPLKKIEVDTPSTEWFKYFIGSINQVPNKDNKTKVEGQNGMFTLNNVIPRDSFYVLNGTYNFHNEGSNDDKIIVTKPNYIKTRQLNNILRVVFKKEVRPKAKLNNEEVKYNKKGTMINTVHNSKTNIPLTCHEVEVDENGDPVSNVDDLENRNKESNEEVEFGYDEKEEKMRKIINKVILVIVGLGMIAIFGFGIMFFTKKLVQGINFTRNNSSTINTT